MNRALVFTDKLDPFSAVDSASAMGGRGDAEGLANSFCCALHNRSDEVNLSVFYLGEVLHGMRIEHGSG